MLRVDITDPTNQTDSNDYLIEANKAGTYPERIGLKTLTAMNCDPSHSRMNLSTLMEIVSLNVFPLNRFLR